MASGQEDVRCPHCGHCKHCGAPQYQPYWPYGVLPIWPYPQPYWYEFKPVWIADQNNPTVTFTSTSAIT